VRFILLLILLLLAGPLAAQTITYTVRPGDTLYRIALDHGVSVDDLIAANDIDNPALIVVGQRLTIPVTADTPIIIPDQDFTLSPPVRDYLNAIYIYGQSLGNNPHAFAKVGDSITVSTDFLHPIGTGQYDLGAYGYLQPVVDHYSQLTARGRNAFRIRSLAAGVGWSALAVLDPSFADETACLPGESPLVCEYRLTKPSVALIMFGTNDVGYRTPDEFRANLTRIVQTSIQMGVIPILSTIPARPDMPDRVALFNAVIIDVAGDLPLWDYHAVSRDLPNNGLAWDNLHPSSPGFELAADFTNLGHGYTIRNLTALQILYRVWSNLDF